VIIPRISNLDASTGEYPEEEGCYQEEEEENLENYQGKLILLQVQSPFGARHHDFLPLLTQAYPKF
jgi:hypothetical protein